MRKAIDVRHTNSHVLDSDVVWFTTSRGNDVAAAKHVSRRKLNLIRLPC